MEIEKYGTMQRREGFIGKFDIHLIIDSEDKDRIKQAKRMGLRSFQS